MPRRRGCSAIEDAPADRALLMATVAQTHMIGAFTRYIQGEDAASEQLVLDATKLLADLCGEQKTEGGAGCVWAARSGSSRLRPISVRRDAEGGPQE